MNDTNPEGSKRGPSLNAAIRAARLDEAERSQALGDLRGAEMARLDLLREALDPILAQIPAEVDLFDIGIAPGERPRLFIDMISFVEMGRDRRTYRFLQDTRNGRILLAETESLGAVLDALTRHIARRLVEREKALAALHAEGPPPPSAEPEPDEAAGTFTRPGPTRGPGRSPARVGLGRAVRVVVDGLGLVALAALAWIGFRVFGGHAPGR